MRDLKNEIMKENSLLKDVYVDLFLERNQVIELSEELILSTKRKMENVKPKRWNIYLKKTIATIACTVLLFISAVNLSPAFASTVVKVPIMRELTLAVMFDPSMKVAIEHNYIQLVKQVVSDNGYQLDVEYLVADARNLTIFYQMQGMEEEDTENEERYRFDFELQDMSGNRLESYGASWSTPTFDKKNTLCEVKFHFTNETTLPEQVQLQLKILQEHPYLEDGHGQRKINKNQDIELPLHTAAHYEESKMEYEQVACISMPLAIEHESLFNVRTLEINRMVELEGQKVIIDKVEIYPTQVRVLWHEDSANTQYISDMEISLQSKMHGCWEKIGNGISGVGMLGEPRQIWLESSWFSDECEYQLVLEKYAMIPKEKQMVTYDYVNNSFTNLPEYARLVEATPCDTGLFMQFEFCNTDERMHGNVLQCESVNQVGSGKVHGEGFGNKFDQNDEAKGIYWFYNQFIVSEYETVPITFRLTWAPLKRTETIVTVPLT